MRSFLLLFFILFVLVPTQAQIKFDVEGDARISGRLELSSLGNSLFIGKDAGKNDDGTDNNNTFIGDSSGVMNISGNYNVFLGYKSGYNNKGGGNIFLGSESGYENQNGSINTYIGDGTGYHNKTGIHNTFVGWYAGRNNLNNNNVFIGGSCGSKNTLGYENVFVGASSGFDNTIGNQSTFIGYKSGHSYVSGIGGVGLGFSSNSLGTDYDNSTGLGFDADPDGSNVIRIGNANITSIKAKFDITVDSDARFKTQITKDNVPGLDFIKKLTPVTYYYDSKKYADWKYAKYGEIDSAIWDSKYDSDKILTTGFIAQEVEAAAKSIGYEFSGVDTPTSDKATYGLRYSTFVVPLVKAVQEQQDIIEEQQKKILLLEKEVSRNDEQDRKIEELENLIAQLLETKNSEQKGGGNQDVYLSRQPTIDQNIPNPFNGTTVINYYIPESFEKDCTIIITNVEGKEIQRIGINSKGDGSITLDANQLISGSYNYSLMVDGRIYTTKRMILQR
jgi:hypothetical protein